MSVLLNEKQKQAVALIARGMTYQEVADELKTTYTTVYRWRQKEAFKEALEQAHQSLSMAGCNTEQQMKDELDAYRRGRMDGLVIQAINTLANVMSTGTNESAKVGAAKYVLEKFAGTLGVQEDNTQLEELKSMLRIVGE